MSKEHVKLYKSKKTWVAATVAAAVLGISGVTTVNNVNADALPASIVKNEPATTANGQHPNDKVAANMQYNRGIDPLTDNALKNETPAQQQKAKAYMDTINGTSASSANANTNTAKASSTKVSAKSSSNVNSVADNGEHPSDKVMANMQYNRGIDPLTDNALKNETPAQQQLAKEYVEALNNGESVAEAKAKLGLGQTSASKTSTSVKKANANQNVVVKKNANSAVANKQVKTAVVNTANAAQSKNASASSVKNALPTTGEAQSKNTVALGVEAISLGAILGGLSFLKRKHN
ncbi:KxYKxGKxW signal peptide domain-containing protein [Ligilactobacillus aviarius]|uniref:KxYKxGKxW signal peptide domain-containing protein n=1 Tax=Ligilactobacillus aviarius TaxID=1606 RepID=UPI00255B8FFC|nr:KxYKxGKxW signal peptide domain-containing protein [Ligilactobacillus aviarius]